MVLGLAVVLTACNSGGGSARDLRATAEPDQPNTVVATGTRCDFDGDRKVTAQGVVRNVGEKPYQVQIAVRFVDEGGVRVDLASDSVSDLQPNESARWDATIYTDDGGDVRACEVSTRTS